MSKIVYPSYWQGNIIHFGDIHTRITIAEPTHTLCGIATNTLSKQPRSSEGWYECLVCQQQAAKRAVELRDAPRDGGGTGGEAGR